MPITAYNIHMDKNYLSVAQTAKKWGVSERSVRNYCAQGQIDGAFVIGKTWSIPETASKPARKNKERDTLLGRLRFEKDNNVSGGIYHKVQIDLTFNSNHIEGSTLTHDQTRYIYETNTVGIQSSAVNVDDIVETVNHFKCIDAVIDGASRTLSETFIKELHRILKSGTSDGRKGWFAVGDYKRLPNEVGGNETVPPKDVSEHIKKLLADYNALSHVTLGDILEFHYRFERIHPFQDGNGRIGRLIMFKECLKNNIVPFIIDEGHKIYYYRGLNEWRSTRGYLKDTCLSAQDNFKLLLDYFKIDY